MWPTWFTMQPLCHKNPSDNETMEQNNRARKCPHHPITSRNNNLTHTHNAIANKSVKVVFSSSFHWGSSGLLTSALHEKTDWKLTPAEQFWPTGVALKPCQIDSAGSSGDSSTLGSKPSVFSKVHSVAVSITSYNTTIGVTHVDV